MTTTLTYSETAAASRPYAEANHPPVPVLRHAAAITVESGGYFQLDARDSTDPDGDSLAFWWIHYPEAGSYRGAPPRFAGAENMARVTLIAPEVEEEETTHVILRVTDRGSPPLSRYQRVIVTVKPRGPGGSGGQEGARRERAAPLS